MELKASVMTHTIMEAIAIIVGGYCDVHGTNSAECGAAKKVGGLAIIGVGIVGLVAALKSLK